MNELGIRPRFIADSSLPIMVAIYRGGVMFPRLRSLTSQHLSLETPPRYAGGAMRRTSENSGKDEVPRIPLPRRWVNRPLEFASHADDHFSSSVSFFQIPDGFGDLTQRVRPVDDRL